MVFYCGHDFCGVPLITKHIDVGRITRIRNPTVIPFTVYQCVPMIIMLFWQLCSRIIQELAFSCTCNCIFYSGHNLCRIPLITEHIDVGRITRIWFPTKVKAGCMHNCKLVGLTDSSSPRIFHVLCFCGATNHILQCGPHFRRQPLIAKHIAIRRICRIRSPGIIKVHYIVQDSPYRHIRCCYCNWFIHVTNHVTVADIINHRGF